MLNIVVIFYIGLSLIVGIFLSRRVKKASDFLLAGRKLGLLLTTATLSAVGKISIDLGLFIACFVSLLVFVVVSLWSSARQRVPEKDAMVRGHAWYNNAISHYIECREGYDRLMTNIEGLFAAGDILFAGNCVGHVAACPSEAIRLVPPLVNRVHWKRRVSG